MGMNKDRCSPDCIWQPPMTMRLPSLSMEPTLWLADGRGRKKWAQRDGMELLGWPAWEHALPEGFSSHCLTVLIF